MGNKPLNLDHSLRLVAPCPADDASTMSETDRWSAAWRLAFLVLAAAAAWTVVIDSLDGLGQP